MTNEIHDGMDAPPSNQLDAWREFIETAGWRSSVRYPDAPHEYTVRGRPCGDKTEAPPPAQHDWFVRQIREHGYREKYDGHTYDYLEVDGHKYWPIPPVIINRVPLEG